MISYNDSRTQNTLYLSKKIISTCIEYINKLGLTYYSELKYSCLLLFVFCIVRHWRKCVQFKNNCSTKSGFVQSSLGTRRRRRRRRKTNLIVVFENVWKAFEATFHLL